MSEAEVSQFLCVLIKMGEALQNSGAEVFRVEDTLNRIAAAYGAEEVNIFVITSSIVVTLTMPDLPPQTQTRRLRKSTGNDLLELEQLNALSRPIWREACWRRPALRSFLAGACGTACWRAGLQCSSAGWSGGLPRSA